MSSIVWDRDVAEVYDRTYRAKFEGSVLEPIVDLLADLAGGGSALEFAVGTGRVALSLSARGIAVHGPHGQDRGLPAPGPLGGLGSRPLYLRQPDPGRGIREGVLSTGPLRSNRPEASARELQRGRAGRVGQASELRR